MQYYDYELRFLANTPYDLHILAHYFATVFIDYEISVQYIKGIKLKQYEKSCAKKPSVIITQ